MKILVNGLNYTPELTGVGKYTGEMVEWLAGRGHAVRVVTAPPYYPAWRVAEGYSGCAWRREVHGRAEVWRCPLWVPRRPSGAKRLLHLMSFAAASFPVLARHGLFWRPDVVLTVAPALFSAPGGRIAAWCSGAPAWLHLQDLEVDAAFELGLLPKGPLRGLVSRLEALLLSRFERVSTISSAMDEALSRKGLPKARRALFPNWVDTETLSPDPEGGKALRAALGVPPGCAHVLYSGNMAEKQGLETVVEAASLLSERRDIRFSLCGDGPARPGLEQSAAGLENVRFLPLQPAETLPALLSSADVHLVVQRRGAADLVMPSKLTAILAVGGNAVITAEEGTELGRFVRENLGIATLCAPEDPRALAGGICETLANGRRGVNSHARAYAVARLDKHAILSRFEEEIIALARGDDGRS